MKNLIFLIILALQSAKSSDCLDHLLSQVSYGRYFNGPTQSHILNFSKNYSFEIQSGTYSISDALKFLKAVSTDRFGLKKYLTKKDIEIFENKIMAQYPSLTITQQVEFLYYLSATHKVPFTKRILEIARPISFSDEYLSKLDLLILTKLLQSYLRFTEVITMNDFELWIKYSTLEVKRDTQITFQKVAKILDVVSSYKNVFEHVSEAPLFLWNLNKIIFDDLIEGNKKASITTEQIIIILKAFQKLEFELPENLKLFLINRLKKLDEEKLSTQQLSKLLMLLSRHKIDLPVNFKQEFFKRMKSFVLTRQDNLENYVLPLDVISVSLEFDRLSRSNLAVIDLIDLIQTRAIEDSDLTFQGVSKIFLTLRSLNFDIHDDLIEKTRIETQKSSSKPKLKDRIEATRMALDSLNK